MNANENEKKTMLHRLQIRDKSPKGLYADLREILAGVPARLHGLRWVILELEASGNVKPVLGISTAELMRKIAAARAGYPVSWENLSKVAKNLIQTDRVVLAGYSEGVNPHFGRFLAGISVFPGYTLLIQGMNKDFWEVTAQEPDDLDDLTRRFDDTVRSTILPDPEPKPALEPEPESEAEAESESDPEVDLDSDPDSESESEPEIEPESETQEPPTTAT